MSNYKQRGRTELALLYNPNLDSRTAWRRLSAWIDQCEPLKKELMQMGYNGHQRTFTPKQVNRSVHYLGEP